MPATGAPWSSTWPCTHAGLSAATTGRVTAFSKRFGAATGARPTSASRSLRCSARCTRTRAAVKAITSTTATSASPTQRTHRRFPVMARSVT